MRFSILRFCSASGRISASSSLKRAWISSSVSGTACTSSHSPVTQAPHCLLPHAYLLAPSSAMHSPHALLPACIRACTLRRMESSQAAVRITHIWPPPIAKMAPTLRHVANRQETLEIDIPEKASRQRHEGLTLNAILQFLLGCMWSILVVHNMQSVMEASAL